MDKIHKISNPKKSTLYQFCCELHIHICSFTTQKAVTYLIVIYASKICDICMEGNYFPDDGGKVVTYASNVLN
jgi:hypothetical protein